LRPFPEKTESPSVPVSVRAGGPPLGGFGSARALFFPEPLTLQTANHRFFQVSLDGLQDLNGSEPEIPWVTRGELHP
jgi:hypothetical protein